MRGKCGMGVCLHTVGDRIDVILWGRSVSRLEVSTKNSKITHDPEQPSLHGTQRHPDSRVLKNVHEENDGNPESRVEIAEDEPKCPEEGLHHQEDQVNDQVIGPKTTRGAIEVGHEVDDDVVDENPGRGEGKICKHVGNREGCSSVHAITRLSYTRQSGPDFETFDSSAYLLVQDTSANHHESDFSL